LRENLLKNAHSREMQVMNLLSDRIRVIDDFPISGIRFKDIAPALAEPGVLSSVLNAAEPVAAALAPDRLLAVDARGFILGAALADRLRAGLVLVRKPGKLPGEVDRFDYTCEYCSGQLEVTAGSVRRGDRCLVVDDVLATGGTARAVADYARTLGATVVGYCFMLEIVPLLGRARLQDAPVFAFFSE
jgi:adenine phosphoribosyltransferase